MTNPNKALLALFLIVGMGSQSVSAAVKKVGQVVWNTEKTAEINTTDIPADMSQLIFVRFADNLPTTTNANLSIDDDYQISLASNHLTTTMVCSGNHELSTQSTANKSNDLLYNDLTINTESSETYFYRVVVSEQGETTISPLTENTKVNGQSLVNYLATVPRQAHQISRVVTDCSAKATIQVPHPIVVVEPTY